MGIKKSDAKFTEPFVGTTEVIIMMSVQGGRSTSSAVRLDYNAVHALEKAIVDYTFLDDTPQTDCEDTSCPYFKNPDYSRCMKCKSQTESTGSPIGDYRDGVGAWQTDCGWGEDR